MDTTEGLFILLLIYVRCSNTIEAMAMCTIWSRQGFHKIMSDALWNMRSTWITSYSRIFNWLAVGLENASRDSGNQSESIYFDTARSLKNILLHTWNWNNVTYMYSSKDVQINAWLIC